MTQRELEAELAAMTGESRGTIRRRGFSVVNPGLVDFDPEPNDLPAQMLDWDVYHESLRRAA